MMRPFLPTKLLKPMFSASIKRIEAGLSSLRHLRVSRGSFGICIFAVLALLFTVGPRFIATGQPAAEKPWVVRIAYNTKGTPIGVDFRWPFERVGQFGIIRVPWDYRHQMFGPEPAAQLFSNMEKTQLERGYTAIFFGPSFPIWSLTAMAIAQGAGTGCGSI